MKIQPVLLNLLVLLFLCLIGVFITFTPARASSTTITVNTTADELNTDGNCSLREAIRAANLDTAVDACLAGNGADTIILPFGSYTLTIVGADEDASSTGDLDITGNLTITGAGADSTIIDGNGLMLSDHVIQVFSGVKVNVAGVTIRNGYSYYAFANPPSVSGGGVANSGALTLTNSTISGNYASGSGGGLSNSDGGTLTLINSIVSGNSAGLGCGGISNGGRLTLINSTISTNNTATDGGGLCNGTYGVAVVINSAIISNTTVVFGRGGGIFNSGGTLTLTNSTISGNSSRKDGGGIFNYGFSFSASTVTLSNVTLTNNAADNDSNGSGDGGGIGSNGVGTISIKNTILAQNVDESPGTQYPECSGALTSHGYNLIQTLPGCTITGTSTGNLTDVTPFLGPLQNNGGPTLTHALLALSPAIDAGNPSGCTDNLGAPIISDQRGLPRPVDGNGDGNPICDIGAYEVQEVLPIHQVHLPLVLCNP